MIAYDSVFGATITPNPVETGKTYKVSIDVDDVFAVFSDVNGNPIRDTNGAVIYVSMDETLKVMKDISGNPIRDISGETIGLEI